MSEEVSQNSVGFLTSGSTVVPGVPATAASISSNHISCSGNTPGITSIGGERQ
jgi:hypothetical protein